VIGRKDRWVVSSDSHVRLPVIVIKYRDLDVPEKLENLDAFSLRARRWSPMTPHSDPCSSCSGTRSS
jgi:hypothetical protein